jgi:carbamoyl-phosphate synthase large subunit
MRLLVTNTKVPQAYAIIRALRPFADHIVATMPGKSRRGQMMSFAAYSRLVDSRYPVRPPDDDRNFERLQAANTDLEAAYLEQILSICERERIDVIFPSHDVEVTFFSKNKSLFEGLGIHVPVPDLDLLRLATDKLRTIKAAEGIGFPVPRTFDPKSAKEVAAVIKELPPPWVIKPRSSFHAYGLHISNDPSEILHRYEQVKREYGAPMIQEYIPGRSAQNFHTMSDAQGRLYYASCPRGRRQMQRLYRNSTASCLSSGDHPMIDKVEALIGALGWRGALTIQTKIDARDGKAKLMEVNGRLGSTLWFTTVLGINAPLFSIFVDRGQALEGEVQIPEGIVLVDPIEDVINFFLDLSDWAVFHVRTKFLRKAPVDPQNIPLPLGRLLRSYAADYFGPNEIRLSPQSRYFFSDFRAGTVLFLYKARAALSDLKRVGR